MTSASVIERAIAKLRGADAEVAPPPSAVAAPHKPDPRIEIDPERLAGVGIFTPDASVNRTTEEFRLIKRAVLEQAASRQANGSGGGTLLMVTSTREGEGKSFVALNLAFSIAAERDRSVVLVDADPAKSSVAKLLGVETAYGLMDQLEDDVGRPDEILLPTNVEHLAIVPAGRHLALGAELLASDRMGTVLRMLCPPVPGSVVIIDAPPVLATSEPRALARHVDQTILVVEADRTSRAAINEALNLIGICPNIGLVLNKARFRFGVVRFGAYYKSYYKGGKRVASLRG